MPESNPEPHVYTNRNPTVNYLMAVFLAGVGIFVMSGYSTRHPAPPVSGFQALLGLVVIAGALYLAYNTAVTRLSVSASGLDYHDALTSCTAPWDDARELRQVAVRYGYNTVLALDHPRRKIGLSQFGSVGPDSPLGQDLRAYAPRLFPPDDGAGRFQL